MKCFTFENGLKRGQDEIASWEAADPAQTRLRLSRAIMAFDKKNDDLWDQGYTQAFKDKLEELS